MSTFRSNILFPSSGLKRSWEKEDLQKGKLREWANQREGIRGKVRSSTPPPAASAGCKPNIT
jgi:hypothetical protein